MMTKEIKNEGKTNKSGGDESSNVRNKLKKVEMLVFSGSDPDSWLFRANRYFQIHKLTDSEKLTVMVISFDGATLDWYRSQEECDPFVNWTNLKQRLLVRF